MMMKTCYFFSSFKLTSHHFSTNFFIFPPSEPLFTSLAKTRRRTTTRQSLQQMYVRALFSSRSCRASERAKADRHFHLRSQREKRFVTKQNEEASFFAALPHSGLISPHLTLNRRTDGGRDERTRALCSQKWRQWCRKSKKEERASMRAREKTERKRERKRFSVQWSR